MTNDLDQTNPKVAKILDKLTSKQAKFCMILAQKPTISATQAHIDADYKGTYNTHGVSAHQLIRNPKVIAAVTSLKALLGTEYKLTRESVLARLEDAVTDCLDHNDRPNLLRALELQGKAIAMWTEKRQVEDVTERDAMSEREQEEARRIAQIRLAQAG